MGKTYLLVRFFAALPEEGVTAEGVVASWNQILRYVVVRLRARLSLPGTQPRSVLSVG